MADQQDQSEQPSARAWTEPSWSGWIETTGDALRILEAAKRGLIPRVTRCLVGSELDLISSGSVFVFDEKESGIRRWTDGRTWSASRIFGNFLLYREMEKRDPGHRTIRADQEPNVAASDGSEDRQPLPWVENDDATANQHLERFTGSLSNSRKLKPDGLLKKTFTITIHDVPQHLISYYTIDDLEKGRLLPPSSLPELSSLDISPEYLDLTHFRKPPKVVVGEDGIKRYRGEAEDVEAELKLSSLLESLAIAKPE